MKITPAQVVGAAASLIVALLLHSFYVDYEIDAKSYLLSWPASSGQRDHLIDRLAAGRVRPEKVEHGQVNDGYSQEMAHIEKYCERIKLDRSVLNFSRDPNDKAYFRCSKPFVSAVVWKKYVTPGVTLAQAREASSVEVDQRAIAFGMVPAAAVAGDNPSRGSLAKSYWLGVILPFSLLALAMLLLGSALRRPRPLALIEPVRSPSSQEYPSLEEQSVDEVKPAPVKPSNTVVVDMIKRELGNDFPLSAGTGKPEDPFVVTATSDYVSVEHAIARHVFGNLGEEFQLSTQKLANREGRMIDELIFDAKKSGEAEWKGIRRFYFDITAGFTAGRRPLA